MPMKIHFKDENPEETNNDLKIFSDLVSKSD